MAEITGQTLSAHLALLNRIFTEIQTFKRENPKQRIGYNAASVGSILNAYREGDLGFDEAIATLVPATAPPAPVDGTARPLSEWHEDYGPVLWWEFPISEPPYVGDPNCCSWPGYHTHWTRIPLPTMQSDDQPAPVPPTDRAADIEWCKKVLSTGYVDSGTRDKILRLIGAAVSVADHEARAERVIESVAGVPFDCPSIHAEFVERLTIPRLAQLIAAALAAASGPGTGMAQQQVADELASIIKWMRDNEPVTVIQVMEVLRNREGVNRIEATRNARSATTPAPATNADSEVKFALSGHCDNDAHSSCPYPEKCRCACHRPEGLTARGDERCAQCGHVNHVPWFAPSPIWNKVVRQNNLPEMLCPACFIELAEGAGFNPTAWRVSPELSTPAPVGRDDNWPERAAAAWFAGAREFAEESRERSGDDFTNAMLANITAAEAKLAAIIRAALPPAVTVGDLTKLLDSCRTALLSVEPEQFGQDPNGWLYRDELVENVNKLIGSRTATADSGKGDG